MNGYILDSVCGNCKDAGLLACSFCFRHILKKEREQRSKNSSYNKVDELFSVSNEQKIAETSL